MRFCIYCGAPAAAGEQRFCGSCGRPLAQPVAPTTAAEDVTPQASTRPLPDDPAELADVAAIWDQLSPFAIALLRDPRPVPQDLLRAYESLLRIEFREGQANSPSQALAARVLWHWPSTEVTLTWVPTNGRDFSNLLILHGNWLPVGKPGDSIHYPEGRQHDRWDWHDAIGGWARTPIDVDDLHGTLDALVETLGLGEFLLPWAGDEFGSLPIEDYEGAVTNQDLDQAAGSLTIPTGQVRAYIPRIVATAGLIDGGRQAWKLNDIDVGTATILWLAGGGDGEPPGESGLGTVTWLPRPDRPGWAISVPGTAFLPEDCLVLREEAFESALRADGWLVTVPDAYVGPEYRANGPRFLHEAYEEFDRYWFAAGVYREDVWVSCCDPHAHPANIDHLNTFLEAAARHRVPAAVIEQSEVGWTVRLGPP